MATVPLSVAGVVAGRRAVPFDEGLRLSPPASAHSSSLGAHSVVLGRRSFRGLTVMAATVIAPKYTSIKPLGDRVLVNIKSSEDKTSGGILLPTTAQSKPQEGEVVAVGEGRTIGNNKIDISVQAGSHVVYSKYAGTELQFNGSSHLLLKEDDIVGIIDFGDVKDLNPLGDRVLIKIFGGHLPPAALRCASTLGPKDSTPEA